MASRACAVLVGLVVLALIGAGFAQDKPAGKEPTTKPAEKDKAFEAFKKKQTVPCAKVPLVKKAPKIDGVLDPLYKEKATPLAFKFITGGQAKPTAATTVYAVTTQDSLVVFFDCKSPDMDALLADVREHDGQVWNDDCVELFIDPTNKRQVDGYVHIVINSIGTTSEAKGPQGAEDYSWNPKLKLKTKIDKKGWAVEVAIPLKELVKDVKKIHRVWAINFNRMAYLIEGNEDTCWSPTGQQSSHVPSKFGCLWMQIGKVDNTK